jgi:hypothetical protein
MPRTRFRTLTHVVGSPCELASAPPATASTIAPTSASPIYQPTMKAGPFTRPLGHQHQHHGDDRSALSATPTATGSDCPMAWPMARDHPEHAGREARLANCCPVRLQPSVQLGWYAPPGDPERSNADGNTP